MRIVSRPLASTALCLLLCTVGYSQKAELRVQQKNSETVAVPGQLIEIMVEGTGERLAPSLPIERFEVLVVQDGTTHTARVRGATPVMTTVEPVPLNETNISSPDTRESLSNLKQFCKIVFTVPQGLSTGDATATVIYNSVKRSDTFRFRVVHEPPKPHVAAPFSVLSFSNPRRVKASADLVVEATKDALKTGLTFERGREALLEITPLIDPEFPNAGVLMTFKQGNISREVATKVTHHEAVEQGPDNSRLMGPVRYEVSVHTPEELLVGPVELEVRLRAGGQLSEPGLAKGTVVDPSTGNHDALRPRITSLAQTKVGIGQAFQIAVQDGRQLDPDPSKALVILEQDSRRIELTPERDIPIMRMGSSGPVILSVRIRDELVGQVIVRVYNPALGEDAGLSQGVPLEIAGEVLPPVITRVLEAGKQDIGLLTAMREQALLAGHEFREYNPSSRYVTIRATGMDYNPSYVRIRFTQAGRSYKLSPDDFSLSMPDRWVVRLPDGVQPGQAQVTIQNLGNGSASSPGATAIVEITRPATKR